MMVCRELDITQSRWLGPPSLGAGLSRAACMGLFVIDSPATISTLPTQPTAKFMKHNGSNKASAGTGRRSTPFAGHGKKRRRGSESIEHKPAKAPRVARTRKKNNRGAQKA